MVHRSGQCIARAGWEAAQGLLDGGLPVRPLHEPVHHLLEHRWPQPGKHPTPTTQAQPPGAGLTSCINPSPDMTTSASQRLRSSARTSSRAWFRRSAERAARLSRRGLGWGLGVGGGSLAGDAPCTPAGRHSPVSVSVKETSAWASRGCTWLRKSCRALPLPPRGFNSTSTRQGLGSGFREPPAVKTNPNRPLGG